MALEPLTTGQLLDKTFQLYRKHFLLFAGIAVIPPALSAVSSVALASGNAVATIGGVVGLIIYLGAIAMGQAATSLAVADVYLDRPTGVGSAYRRVAGKTLRYFVIIMVLGIATAIGFLLLIIPGVIVLITYALTIVASVNEDLGFTAATKRSKELVKGNRGRIALIFLLSIVITYAAAFGLAIPADLVSEKMMESSPLLANIILQLSGVVAATLSTPIGLIGFTLAYYDARVRKEAFDLQLMMEQSATPKAATAGA
jgi:hypothetical protein